MTPKRDGFFLGTTLAIAAVVFTGFWFTYFGPMFTGNRRPSSSVVHLHGWSFFAWYILVVVQVALVHKGRLSLHRTLGGLSVVLAALMVGTGLLVVGVRMADALDKGNRFWSASGPAVFATLALFVGFYAAALQMRRRSDWHKRLMIVACAGGMGAATFRLSMALFGPQSAMWIGLLGSNVFILAGIVYDWLRAKRVHPAWWIGLATCAVIETSALLLAPAYAWHALAHGLAAIGRTFRFLY
jgi:hypothetical protein